MIPRPLGAAHSLVQRDALFERLSASEAGGVVLVCAPAGSGKTVLLRSWIGTAGLEGQVGWVSVGRAERDAQSFWLSVIGALAGAVGVVQQVAPAPTFNGRAVVEQVLADLESLEEPGVLVIDDLHELESADALEWLEMFLASLRWGLRVVLATREDPRIGLHRLRLSGQLTELRAPDMRFSMEETVALLRAEGITLSDGATERLYQRTEGWAAGLRLAAISLAHHPDPERFVTEFAGSERNVAAYLLAEVLERQTPDVRDMLLRTSVLERVCGPLAESSPAGKAPSGCCKSSRTPTRSSPPSTQDGSGFAITISSPTSFSWSSGEPRPRTSDRCIWRQRNGTSARASSSRRHATRRRDVTGGSRPVCWRTITSI